MCFEIKKLNKQILPELQVKFEATQTFRSKVTSKEVTEDLSI